MSDVTLRGYAPSDRQSVADITAGAWGGVSLAERRQLLLGTTVGGREWWEHKVSEVLHLCDTAPERVLVGTVGDEVVGYSSWGVDASGTVGTVGNNAVDPAFRGRGYGRRLVQAAVDRLVAQRVEVLQVQTLVDDEPARRIYEGLGFEEIGRTVHYVRASTAG